MEKSKVILGLKHPRQFSIEERKLIVEEYLQTGKQKREIWKKYTGRSEEKGDLLKWMRQLGYDIPTRYSKLVSSNLSTMPKKKIEDSIENIQLKEKIAQLEKALLNSELRATAYETMIEVAEKELNIVIKKKSFTKQSIK
jgi:transposase-like protein